ncbi:class I glutamine amidotransferase-like protein [Amniculicola lignicola CBS 123094]|uniref:Class I glutamine amidotransferase-like protein n=1 Tax=Amniculicola lignicola CBS 123094 TaxID=1392246 RepID=A0A6A5WR37_9PLEO|nr:class I glutamine amidotransferase-like protein [Amniculicola lignicola CBS 123094]
MVQFSVAVFIYPGADILDFAGPIEIYTTGSPPGVESPFKLITFAHENPLQASAKALTVVPDATFSEVESKIEEYDLLVVPGAAPDLLKTYIDSKEGGEIQALLRKFVTLSPRKEQGQRVLQSVCTGSLLLGASGILAHRTVTSHHMSYDLLKELCDKAAGGDSCTNVVRNRWVDAGTTEAGVRIVNAGGVSSGLDASLFISELLAGKERANWAAEIVEFERRAQDDGWGA